MSAELFVRVIIVSVLFSLTKVSIFISNVNKRCYLLNLGRICCIFTDEVDIYVQMHEHTHLHTFIHICIYIYIHTYTHTTIHTHTYIHTHMHAYIHTYIYT